MADNTYIHISDLPTLTDVQEQTWVAVETSGKEGKKVDLSTIQPGGSVQSDWNQDDSTQPDFIKNKPEIPSLEGYATESWVEGKNYLVSGDLEDIQETLDNHETAIGIVASDVDDVSAAVTAIDTQVGEINSAVNELSETVEDQGESIDALAESITAVSGDIADIQQELTGYAKQDDLDEISDIVEQHADAILDAQADINDISAAVKDIDEALSDYATQDYVQEAVSGKVDKEEGKGLSTNDYTDADMAVVDLAAEVIPDDADIDNKLVSQSTLNTALANFAGYEVVDVDASGMPAPTGTINPHIIYLTKDTAVTGKDQFKEWIYDSQWELVGDTSMDLNGYATEQWVEDKNYLVSADLAPYAKEDDLNTLSATVETLDDEVADHAERITGIEGDLDELDQLVGEQGQAIVKNTSDISDVSAAVDDIDSALDDFATKDALDTGLATKLDTTAFSTVSGKFLSADSSFTANLGQGGTLQVNEAADLVIRNQANVAFFQTVQFSAYGESLNVGQANSAGYASSLAAGNRNYAESQALAQGNGNTAKYGSIAQGIGNSAELYSIAQGYGNSATDYAQAFGRSNVISHSGMAIGKYNETSADASFVIGNGTDDANRSDLFIIKHDGTVSSTGDFIVDDKSLSSVFDTVCANSATWDAVSDMVDTNTFETATAELSDDINLVASSVADNIADINYLSGAISSLPTQVQSDWTEEDTTSPAYILNKPAELDMSAGDGIGITETAGALIFEVTGNYADADDVANNIEVLSAAIDETSAKVDVSAFNDAVDAINENFDDVDADIAYVSAAVSSIPAQVQSDWTEENTASPAYIQNKPDELDMSAGDGIGITEDNNTLIFEVTGNYASMSDISYLSGAIDNKLDESTFNVAITAIDEQFDAVNDDIEYLSGAVSSIPEQVQSDWTEDDPDNPAYIQNKPAELNMSAGDGIGITESNDTLTFSVTADYASATDLTGKVDKVTTATAGNVVKFGANGTLDDSQFSTAKLVNLYAEDGTTQAVRNYLSINKNTYNVNIGTEDLNSSTIILDRIDAYLMSGDEKTVVAQASASIPANASTNNPLVTTTDMAAAIANFGGFKVVSADQQGYPSVASADTRTVYLVKDTTVTGSDQYKEWIWKDADPQDPQSTSAWELVGDTSMDLNGYVQFPNSYTAGNLVQFGANDTIVDTGSAVSDLTNVQADWSETNSASDAYIANKPAVLIPQESPASLGGIAAPTNIMVVSAMPPAASIDPYTIYLVQGTLTGTGT